jgi:aldehyde:ferredoxin oxidoreductase
LAIEYICECENEFYTHLGKGVKHASKIYGGTEYAMHVAGNEMTGYHTGYGSLTGMAVGARHSHLCNGGYSIDQSLEVGKINVDDMVDALMKEELERCMLNSLIMCLFARKVYDRETILSALNAIGKDLTNDDLTAVAQRNYATKLRIKKAFGFDINNIKLPKRFFEIPTKHGILDEDTAYEILKRFREKTLEMIKDT